MAVGDDDIPHADKAPVAQQGDGALVVPCLFPFPEQRPLVEALRRVPGHETADRRLGGDIQPLGHKLLLYFPDTLADIGRVGVEDMAENDHLVALGQRSAPTVGDAALVRQSQHTARTFLLQLPAFQRLPRHRPDFLQELGPCPRLVGGDEGILLRSGGTELALPGEVLADEVRLGQSLVTTAIVHDGRGRGHRKDRAAFGAYSGGVLFLCRAYGQPRFFRHGSNKPLLATATTGTLAKLPVFTAGTKQYGPICQRQEFS